MLKKILLLDLKKCKIDLICLGWIYENTINKLYKKFQWKNN